METHKRAARIPADWFCDDDGIVVRGRDIDKPCTGTANFGGDDVRCKNPVHLATYSPVPPNGNAESGPSSVQPDRPYARLSINIAHNTADYLKTTSEALGITVTELVRQCVKLHSIIREETEAGRRILIEDATTAESWDEGTTYRQLMLV